MPTDGHLEGGGVGRESSLETDPAPERHAVPVIRPAVPAAARGWRRTSGLIATAVDEALLSVLSLGLALVLIRGGSKAEYGVFALICTVILLFRGVHSSLVLTPLATVGGRLRDRERAAFVRTLWRAQAAIGAVLALAVTGGILAVVGGAEWVLAAGSGLALAGTWLREFRRAAAMLDGRAGGALGGDAVFAVLAVVMTLVPWALFGSVSAGGVLAATGVAASVAAFVGFPRAGGPATGATGYHVVARAAVEQARWTLPGNAIAWGQQSGYIYAVGLVLGTAAVGEVVAARLFVAPLLLVAVAWSRMFLPRAAALLADGGDAVLLARCGRTLKVALIGCGLYLALLVTALALGVSHILPADYAGCEVEILVWAAFAVVNMSRSIACTALMARLEFRALFAMNIAAAALSVLLVVALICPLGATGSIIGLTAGELLLTLLTWRCLLARRRP